MKHRILVVDDEPNILATLSSILADEGYDVLTAGTVSEGARRFEEARPSVVLLDVMLPDGSGLDLLRRFKESRPDCEVVMVSGHATVERAVEATRSGAYDFLEKPLALKRVLLTVARAFERRALARDRADRESDEEARHRMVGNSAAARAVMDQVGQVAPTKARVLITGETGTGKELVAYWVHRLSSRRNGPLVRLNCAAIPRELLESELFGHEKGAFTGAVARKQGKFELAQGGSILLDEIGDMDPLLQAKMLRVLESGEFEPVGSNRPQTTDARVIAATNRDLASEIRAGRFREDLFHRLNVFHIHVPALRERREDIPVLARHFLERYCTTNGIAPKQLSAAALVHLESRSFPGNARELRNLVERAAIVTPEHEIPPAALLDAPPAAVTTDVELVTTARPLARARVEFEKAFLRAQLVRCGWNITRAAGELEVERSNLSRRLKQLGINKPEPYGRPE
ncbi:sigma-54-dependent Fis family transcriptional regulator [candidate division WOR-3 bacterium]|nr:sigma-54-dependent Fis family transcriptional regulator [candidate division WOR-3 bacterium]